ncbi:DNA-directed RNA polymerase [Lithospermum erythrorhizon]|uniref:DNA-directed RNA polymerase n=1 Tax=Lithospermum erythrorhizon TaxID=34254 RepID=A0AAV3NSA4_LITER
MASDDNEVTLKIQTLETNSEKFPPIVVRVPSRYDLLKNCQETEEVGASVKVYKDIKRTNRFQVRAKLNGSDVEFIGSNYDGEASRPQLCNYAFALIDKATNTIKMIPIAANKIFRLEPKIGNSDELEDVPQNALSREEKAEAMKDLQLLYSTRKSERERNALRAYDDAETRQDLDKKIEGINLPAEADEVAASSINERNLPPYDLEASDPSRAYPLEKIISKGEWRYLLDVFHVSQVGGEVTPEVYPSFVCNRVHKLESIKDENEKRKLAGIFSFITHLIRFKDKHAMDSVRSVAHHKIPGILFHKFSSMFVDSESKRLATEKIELLISYVLVLTLFVDDFRTDLTDIAMDLRMPAFKLRSYYESLGCKLVREKQLLLATLPLPLTFPATTRRKRRR